MSKSNKEAQDTGQQSEKMVTKYDLKMQRRKEEKEKELRDKRAGTVGGILLVAVLACIVASFPIRTWLTVNGTYIKVGGENISRVEFDYNYNITANDYISRNYYLLYYMGMDLSGDLSKQMYSDTLTWQDYPMRVSVQRNICRECTAYMPRNPELNLLWKNLCLPLLMSTKLRSRRLPQGKKFRHIMRRIRTLTIP